MSKRQLAEHVKRGWARYTGFGADPGWVWRSSDVEKLRVIALAFAQPLRLPALKTARPANPDGTFFTPVMASVA
jgi:hypothetical protein